MSTDQQPSLNELEEQLRAARLEEAATVQAEMDRREARTVAFARSRASAHDSQALARDIELARRAFLTAVAETPAFAALAKLKAAEWRRHRAGHTHARDLNVIAQADGGRGGHTYDASPPVMMEPTDLIRAMETMVLDQMEAEEQAEAEAEIEATAVSLTPEQIQAEEQVRELERKRAEVVATSVDVTGLSDDERAARGLPTGSSRYPEDGGFRRLIGS